MIEVLEFFTVWLLCAASLGLGLYLGWNYRDMDAQRDAELNARAIIRQSLAEDPKSFMRILKRVK